MRRISTLILLPLLLALAAGCGPIRSTVGIIQAEQVIAEARELGAEEVSPYPMAVAEALVEKAIEEQGYADYSSSWQLAAEARDLVQATIDALPRVDVSEPPIRVDEYEGVDDPTATEPSRRVDDEDEEIEAILEEADEARREAEAEEAEKELEGEEEEEEEEEVTPAPSPWGQPPPEESP